VLTSFVDDATLMANILNAEINQLVRFSTQTRAFSTCWLLALAVFFCAFPQTSTTGVARPDSERTHCKQLPSICSASAPIWFFFARVRLQASCGLITSVTPSPLWVSHALPFFQSLATRSFCPIMQLSVYASTPTPTIVSSVCVVEHQFALKQAVSVAILQGLLRGRLTPPRAKFATVSEPFCFVRVHWPNSNFALLQASSLALRSRTGACFENT
jgi:hypothetical protein